MTATKQSICQEFEKLRRVLWIGVAYPRSIKSLTSDLNFSIIAV